MGAESPLARHRASPAELKEQFEAMRGNAPFLVFRDADDAQCIVQLNHGAERLTIGRRAGNDIGLEWDDEVSRVHAVLEQVGGEWSVVDDGLSSNGSFVNGARIHGRRRLCDGDSVRFGSTVVVFRDPGGEGAGTTRAAEDSAPVTLTDTQRRVLVALCRPYADGDAFATPATNREIAAELYLSLDAVKSALRILFDKFVVGDLPQNAKRVRLVERALQTGTITETDLRAA
jgi:pSer/pThr/pTyr-binding forkhead associated (FHA) protein